MNRHYFISLIFYTLSLSGCANAPHQKHLSLNETIKAESFTQKGQYKQAANLYKTLAQTKPVHKDQFNLLAAEAFVQSGDSLSANTHADTINPASLSAEQRNRLHLLYAQIFLSNGEAEQALNQLSTTQPYTLKTDNQIVFYQSLAFAYSLTGEHLKSAQARIELSPLLTNIPQQHDNNRAILNSLSLLAPQTLALQQPVAQNTLSGWIALTRLIKISHQQQNPDEFNIHLNEWRYSFPQHPANFGFLQEYLEGSSHSFKRPNAIAILLPESGRYAPAAQVIKQGFLAAYNQAEDRFQPPIRFYDSALTDPISLYHQAISEGAELVIGPLSKENIQNLALSTPLTTPVLALNHVQNLVKNNLFQFGLSPIDDTRQITAEASKKGLNKALILTPETKQGLRMAEFLTQSAQQNDTSILETQYYNPKNNDFSQPIKDLLNLDESKYRYSRLKRILGKNIAYTERRRQDVDAIFLSASTIIARSIYPQLRFYRATKVPTYSTSSIYSGSPNPALDIDLNNITFCDIPWVFANKYTGVLSKEMLSELWQPLPRKYLRLVALGIDSFNIITHIADLNTTPYEGATGSLSINAENRVTRQLSCAKFVNGAPLLLNPVEILDTTDETMIYSDDFSQ